MATDAPDDLRAAVNRISNEAYSVFCNERRADDRTKAKNANASREDVFRAGVRAGLASIPPAAARVEEPKPRPYPFATRPDGK